MREADTLWQDAMRLTNLIPAPRRKCASFLHRRHHARASSFTQRSPRSAPRFFGATKRHDQTNSNQLPVRQQHLARGGKVGRGERLQTGIAGRQRTHLPEGSRLPRRADDAAPRAKRGRRHGRGMDPRGVARANHGAAPPPRGDGHRVRRIQGRAAAQDRAHRREQAAHRSRTAADRLNLFWRRLPVWRGRPAQGRERGRETWHSASRV